MVMLPQVQTNFSKMQIGDYVAKAGIYTKPGVVVEKNEDGTVLVDTDASVISQYHRHTNTSGLTPEEKDRFNTIMDDIVSNPENAERINMLQNQIDGLVKDPENRRVVTALRNQQAELIRFARELPRVYSFEGEKIRI
jgi:hypothetical protein